jgi:hypothetical protein
MVKIASVNGVQNRHLLIKIATHVACALLKIVRENYFNFEWRFLLATLACARGLLLYRHIAELSLLWNSRCNTYAPTRTAIDSVSVNLSILILRTLIWASANAILVLFAPCNLDKNMLVFEKILQGYLVSSAHDGFEVSPIVQSFSWFVRSYGPLDWEVLHLKYFVHSNAELN